MTIEEIKEIIQVLLDTGVSELEVQRGENRLWVKRGGGSAEAPQATPVVATAATPVLATPTAPTAPTPAPAVDANLVAVKAPIVGTYYDAASPGSASFVNVGDTVQIGHVL